MIEPNAKLYNKQICLGGAGVAQAHLDEPFRIIVAHFGEQPITLLPKQFVATENPHPENLVEWQISHAEMLVLGEETHDGRFWRRHFNPRYEDIIKRRLVGEREKHMGAEEKPMPTDDIELDFPWEKETAVRDMLWKHERLWSGQLVKIKGTEMRIDFIPDEKPFKSPPYRAGPKPRDIEQSEINKKLQTGVINLPCRSGLQRFYLLPKMVELACS